MILLSLLVHVPYVLLTRRTALVCTIRSITGSTILLSLADSILLYIIGIRLADRIVFWLSTRPCR